MAHRIIILTSFIVLLACAGSKGPVLPPATFEEADRELLQGNYLKAAQLYERLANQHSGRMQWVASHKACVCRLKLNQASQVLPKLQKMASLVRDPKMHALVHDTLSEAHRMMGQYSEALRALLAIQDSGDVIKADDLLYKLGCAYWRAGESPQAVATFRSLLQRHPQSLRAMDAALRVAVKGFGVRIGEPYPASEEKVPPPSAGGLPCSFVKVEVKGRPAVLVAVVSGLPSYDEALRVAEKLLREGVKAEALP